MLDAVAGGPVWDSRVPPSHTHPWHLADQLWRMMRSALGHGHAPQPFVGSVRDPACGACDGSCEPGSGLSQPRRKRGALLRSPNRKATPHLAVAENLGRFTTDAVSHPRIRTSPATVTS